MLTFKEYIAEKMFLSESNFSNWIKRGIINWLRTGVLSLASLLSPVLTQAQTPTNQMQNIQIDKNIKYLQDSVLKELQPYQNGNFGKEAINIVPNIVKLIQNQKTPADQLLTINKINNSFEDMKTEFETAYRQAPDKQKREEIMQDIHVVNILNKWTNNYSAHIGENMRQNIRNVRQINPLPK